MEGTCSYRECSNGCVFTCEECGAKSAKESEFVLTIGDEKIMCRICADPGYHEVSMWECKDSLCAYIGDGNKYCAKPIHSCYGEYCSEHESAPTQGCKTCNDPDRINCISKKCKFVCFDCRALFDIHEVNKVSWHSRIFVCNSCILRGTETFPIENYEHN